MFSLVIFMMVLRAATKRRSRAFLIFLKKKRYCSGMVKTICLCLLFLIFGSAGGAESGMAVMVDDIEIATGRAFEHVIAEIFSFTEKSILYVVQDSIAKFSSVI